MIRKLLLLIMVIALFIELVLTVGIFFAPEMMTKQFHVAFTADTHFLAYIIAWLCGFISAICLLAIYMISTSKQGYLTLCYILGFWWIAIGIGIWLAFRRPDNLFLDSIKGALIVVFTALDKKR